MVISRRLDLALDKDDSGRFLPWILAVSVYFTSVAAMVLIAAQLAVKDWQAQADNRFTVELPAGTEAEAVNAAIDALRREPGIGAVRPLALNEIVALLEPWLPDLDLINHVPLPALLDVTVEDPAAVDWAVAAERLNSAVPGAFMDRGQDWTGPLIRVARLLQAYALGTIAMVLTAGLLAVTFATRSSLAIHRNAVELLYLLGAEDRYITRQFQIHAALRAFAGGIIGLVLALLSLIGLSAAVDMVDSLLLPRIQWASPEIAALLAVPVLIALAAMVTARVTVSRILRQQP